MTSGQIPPGMPPPPLPEFWRKAPHHDQANITSSVDGVQTSKVKEHREQQTWFQQTTPPRTTPNHITFAPFPEPLPIIYPGGPTDADMRSYALPRSFTAPVITLQRYVNNDVPPLAVYHICRICLRPRSARYHREHPIPLDGLPPPPGICRRCRVMSVEEVEKKDVVVESKSNPVKLGLRCAVPEEGYVSAEKMREMKSQKLLRMLSRNCQGDGEGEVRPIRTIVETEGPSPREKDVTYRYVMIRRRSVSRTRSPARVEPAAAVEKSTDQTSSSSTSDPPTNPVKAAKKPSSKATKPDRHEVVSSEAQSDAEVKSKPERPASASSRSVAKVQVETTIPIPPTEAEIRRIARQEIEHYRQAERKMEAHKIPFAHGRMVPVQRRISQVTDISEAMPWKRDVKVIEKVVEKERIYATALPKVSKSKSRSDHNEQDDFVVKASRGDDDERTTSTSQRDPPKSKWEKTAEASSMSGAIPSASSSSKSKAASKTKSAVSNHDSKHSRSIDNVDGWHSRDVRVEQSTWQEEKVEEVHDQRKKDQSPAHREASNAKLYEVVSPWVDAQDEAQTARSHSPDAAPERPKSASFFKSHSHRSSEREFERKERHYQASGAGSKPASACSKTTTDRLYLNEDESEHKQSSWQEDAAEPEQKASSWRGEDEWTSNSRWQGQRTSSSAKASQGGKTEAPSKKNQQHETGSSSPHSAPSKTERQPTKTSTTRSQTSQPPSKQQSMRSESGYLGGDAEYTYTVRTVTPLNRPIQERDFDQVLHQEYEKSEEYLRRRKFNDEARDTPHLPTHKSGHSLESNALSQATNATTKSRISEAGTAGTDGTTRSVRFAKKVEFSPTPPGSEASSSQFRMIGGRGGPSAAVQLDSIEYRAEYRAANKSHNGLTTEDLRRGRSRSRETVQSRSGFDDRFELVGEMRYVPAPEDHRHNRHDSLDSDDTPISKSKPLMRALSESPSRERLNEMLKSDHRHGDRAETRAVAGPYRAPDPHSSKPGSMDVNDGSNAAWGWGESGEAVLEGVMQR